MRRKWFYKIPGIFLMVLVAAALFGFVVQQLWNSLIPTIIGWHAINFRQALGILERAVDMASAALCAEALGIVTALNGRSAIGSGVVSRTHEHLKVADAGDPQCEAYDPRPHADQMPPDSFPTPVRSGPVSKLIPTSAARK